MGDVFNQKVQAYMLKQLAYLKSISYLCIELGGGEVMGMVDMDSNTSSAF